MKIYYDLCQTYGGSEITSFLMQHITSRGSRLTPPQAQLPGGSVLLRSGRTYPPSHLSFPPPLCTLASSGPGVMWGADIGRSVPVGCFQGPSSPLWSLTGICCCLPQFFAPTKQALWALGPPPSPKQDQHAVFDAHRLPCSLSPFFFFPPLLFQLCCSQTQGPDKTLQGMVNVLIMRRPSDSSSVQTLKHGSWQQTKMLLLLICPQMKHFEHRAESLWG